MQVDPAINEAGNEDWESGAEGTDSLDSAIAEASGESSAASDTEPEATADEAATEESPETEEQAESEEDSEQEQDESVEGEQEEEQPATEETQDASQDGAEDESAEAVVEVAPDAETILAEYQQTIQSVEQSVKDEIAEKYIPRAYQLHEAINEAETQIKAIEAKYAPDEDGFAANKSPEDERLLRQLDARVERLTAEREKVASEFEAESRATISDRKVEAYIQANIKKFPVLKQYEDGFRKMVAMGVEVSSPAEALAVSKGLSAVKAGKVKVQSAVKPKAGELERKAIESSIANKRKGAISAGKGSGAKSGPSASKGGSYSNAPLEIQAVLRDLDAEFARA